jgi:hypothetical protein
MWPQYDGQDWDIPYASIILHDFMKYTKTGQEYSNNNHPLLMAEKIRSYKSSSKISSTLEKIASNVESHMSRWNTDRDGNEIGVLPKNMENAFCAISDLISAQKWMKIEFKGNELL